MTGEKFLDNDVASPHSQPPLLSSSYAPVAPRHQQEDYQRPQSIHSSSSSTLSTYHEQRYDPKLPANAATSSTPSSTPVAYHTTPSLPMPSVSKRPSLAEKYTPVDSEPSLLSRNPSNASQRKKKSSACSFPCCGFRSGRTVCGCCACFLLLIVAAVVAILIFAKAPEISFQSVEPPSNGLPSYEVDGPNFTMNFNLKIGIKNPNLIGVTISKVMGEATFPVSDTVIGNGNVADLSIPSQSNQSILFPFHIKYDPVVDPGSKILNYVAKQCGLLGGTKGKLEVNYTIKLDFGFLATFGIVPSFHNKASFDCPLNGAQLPGLETLSATANRRRSLRSPYRN